MLNWDYSSRKDHVASGRTPSLVAVVGPTASGKSELAMKVALEFGGEIITADSRTVYKGMDIGTAKPSKEDQVQVRHWGLDLVEPGERFTAYMFKEYAKKAMADIQKRGKLAILVGGTGLYVDAVLYGFEFRADADLKKRARLENLSIEKLQKIIKDFGYPMPQNDKNKRHLVRTIETEGQTAEKATPSSKNSLLIGLMPSDEMLRENIRRRADKMFKSGLVDETKTLMAKYGDSFLPSAGIVYKLVVEFTEGRITMAEAKAKLESQDWQYARRQRTWFRRNKFIHWFNNPEDAFTSVKKILNNKL